MTLCSIVLSQRGHLKFCAAATIQLASSERRTLTGPSDDTRQRFVEAIQKNHGCSIALYLRTVIVREGQDGKALFEGGVDIFAVSGHEDAWRLAGPAGEEITTVLEIPPVESEGTAVRVGIRRST